MAGLMQVAIWLLCAHLVLKGFEVFQIAYVLPKEAEGRTRGITLGSVMLVIAIIVAVGSFITEEQIVMRLKEMQQNLPAPQLP